MGVGYGTPSPRYEPVFTLRSLSCHLPGCDPSASMNRQQDSVELGPRSRRYIHIDKRSSFENETHRWWLWVMDPTWLAANSLQLPACERTNRYPVHDECKID